MSAIFYHPEAYSTSGPKLMGRHAAGESFLRAWLTHHPPGPFWLHVDKPEHAEGFVRTARAMGRQDPVQAVGRAQLPRLVEAGTVFFPGPTLAPEARLRSVHGDARWSLCGITHTTSSARAMDAIADWVTAPVQDWDAVICTSTAVKGHVMRILEAEIERLQARLGMRQRVLPQLPVIPLGIHTQDFVFTPDQRHQARQAVGASDRTRVVLFMGRLSFHAKAHPLAMYQALEQACQTCGEDVLLIECGWHGNDAIRQAFADAVRTAAPTLRTLTLDGRDPTARQTAWASADIFCSLSDNIQETFGLVPLEAMAAGLPVVVSDWDGYRDTVREGVDGWRIPTCMPPPGTGRDLAWRHAADIDTYDMYCGHTSSMVAVDVGAAARAFVQLLTSPTLRRQMGEQGRARARAQFDWSVILPQYQALWEDLARRRAGASLRPLRHAWPARMDPFDAFSHYASHVLTPNARVGLRAGADSIASFERLSTLAMVNYAKAALPSPEELRPLLEALLSGPRTVEQILLTVAPKRQGLVLRALVWLLKLDVLVVHPLQS